MGVDAEIQAVLERLFDAKFKGLEARMDEKLKGLEARMDDKLEGLETRMDEVKTDVAKLTDGLDRVQSDVGKLDYALNKINLQASRFDRRLSHLEYIPPGGGYVPSVRGFSKSPQGLPGQGLLETDSDHIDAPPYP